MGLLVVVGILAAAFGLMSLAVRRFAAQQRRLGRWDAEGPLVETAPPPHPAFSAEMSERLEVSGQWHGEILRDRRPHAASTDDVQPAPPDEPSRGSTNDRSR